MGNIKSIQKNKKSDAKAETNKTNDATNHIMKFTFKKPANKAKYHRFATVKDHIANQIQCNYEDGKYLAKAIRNGIENVQETQSKKVSTSG